MAGPTIFPSIQPEQDSHVVTSEGLDEDAPAEILEAGECPWCEDYSGEYPERHARKAHPEEWAEFEDDA